MKRLLAIFSAVVMAGAVSAQSAQEPVVIELYTSQGCSSCPPADVLLHELGARDDVIALALHVDYWDYIGWADSFADPTYTRRQKAYARAMGERMVYTPQMIVDGRSHVVGNRPKDVAAAIQAASGERAGVVVHAKLAETAMSLTTSGAVAGPYIVQVVQYMPRQTVMIERGENAGRTMTYSNIVTDWQVVGTWDGTGTFEAPVQASGGDPMVVILQSEDLGPIEAAARLR